MMSEATPAATPMTEMTVMMPMTAWRRLALRYRAATKSSNCIDQSTGRSLDSARFHCSEVGAHTDELLGLHIKRGTSEGVPERCDGTGGRRRRSAVPVRRLLCES